MRIIALIATKNRFDLLKLAVKSVLNQTEQVDDFIIVSDSEENIFNKEKEYLKSFPCKHIQDIYTHNYAGNLNSAIEYIISENIGQINYGNTYIAFLDDDDTWDYDYIYQCKKYVSGKDFLVTGIKYKNEKGLTNLPVPDKLDIKSFLKSNPGIQGSNTFIKLSKLLEAGCFDENMSSTTDRDLFTRVMLTDANYEILDKYLINCEAMNNRVRITNSSGIKAEGLAKFYYKYQYLMLNNEDDFFNRAETIFGFSRQYLMDIIKKSKFTNCQNEAYKSKNEYKNLILERKNMIDKVYSSFTEQEEYEYSSGIYETIKQDKFSVFNSNVYLETPLYGFDKSNYSEIIKEDNKCEKFFSNVYNSYINIENNNIDAYDWLNSLSLKIVNDNFLASIITNTIMEIYYNYGIKENRVFYYDKYCLIAKRLIAKYLINIYRINGLKNILHEEIIKLIDYKKFNLIFNEIDLKGTFDFIRKNIEAGQTKRKFEKNKSIIEKDLKCSIKEILGYGSEGCVFTDYKKIYKWFINSNAELKDYLIKVSEALNGCNFVYEYEVYNHGSELYISYDYVKSYPVENKISEEELLLFIEDMKNRNLVIDNVKAENFMIDNNGLKYIDYGFSVKEYSKNGYEKSIARAKQMVKNIDKDSLYIYKLINKYYIEKEENAK